MEDHLRLSAQERKTCLATYRAARQARRALILLLLAEGRSYREIMASTLAGPAMISAVKKDCQAGGVARVLGTEERSYVVPYWLIVVVRWLLHKTPRDFGFFRTRWSCALLALLLGQQENVSISPETVRRGLARMEFVWRRPRPVVGLRDPQHTTKLRRIQELIAKLAGQRDGGLSRRGGRPSQSQDRLLLDDSRAAGRGGYAREQPEAALGALRCTGEPDG